MLEKARSALSPPEGETPGFVIIGLVVAVAAITRVPRSFVSGYMDWIVSVGVGVAFLAGAIFLRRMRPDDHNRVGAAIVGFTGTAINGRILMLGLDRSVDVPPLMYVLIAAGVLAPLSLGLWGVAGIFAHRGNSGRAVR